MKKNKFLFKIGVLINIFFLIIQLLIMGSIHFPLNYSLLHLLVPVVFIINFLFFIFWLIRPKWPLLLFIFTLAISFNEWGKLYQFKDNIINTPKGLYVMSYNVRSFNRFKWLNNQNIPSSIASFVDIKNPDVVCFQEFYLEKAPLFKNYPYQIFKPYSANGKIGSCIISKYPLKNGNPIFFKGSSNGGMFADLIKFRDTIRIYNIHFESLHLDTEDTILTTNYSQKIRSKIENVFKIQETQINQFNVLAKESDHPHIVCIDLNNNVFSKSYRNLINDRQDAFVKKGEGFGSTYRFSYLPLRIDFILIDPKIEVLDYQTHKVILSDHKPISVVLQLPQLDL